MLEVTLYIVLGATAVLLAVMALRLRKALKTFSPPKYTSSLAHEVDLPSVTVCIPARNEQHALTDSLHSVLASTYEKLEIIVLDDVSGDDTSALIKSFASEGVRFVKGTSLPDGWLGKNYALQGLLNEASGTYLLFMDVDTRLSPNAIENAIRYAISNRAAMVSVLPRREDGWRTSVLFSSLRYFWELMFNRLSSPASASNAWLIRRKLLEERFDGFESVKNAIQPEAKIADQLSITGEYKFLISSELFGIWYEKKWRSQLVTSVRLLFPLLGMKTFFAFVALLALAILLVPYAVLVSLFFTPFVEVHALAIVLSVVSAFLYAVYTHRVWSKGWFIGALLWPLILVQEFILIVASVIQYKRKTVTWKGRTIQPEVQS